MAGKFGKVGKFAIGGIFGEGSAALGTLAVVSLASMRFDWRSGVAGGSAGTCGVFSPGVPVAFAAGSGFSAFGMSRVTPAAGWRAGRGGSPALLMLLTICAAPAAS